MKDWQAGARFPSQIGNWDNELAMMMNRGKEGRRPYAYPESFMRIMAHSMFYFRLPYRQMEGLLRTYNCNNGKGIFPMIPDYTSIQRRVCKLEEKIRCQRRRTDNNNIILATGSTGISVANRGQQMRSKWAKRMAIPSPEDSSRYTLHQTCVRERCLHSG